MAAPVKSNLFTSLGSRFTETPDLTGRGDELDPVSVNPIIHPGAIWVVFVVDNQMEHAFLGLSGFGHTRGCHARAYGKN
ncbi:hypothetical protein [Corallococcus exiguus]|uniref:Uncharacterized protein n=1 Tax=Corallococcus exiguus TaxID=83462 RepID=A0A7X4Y863_9BACT|nr:hypothetical protein [Corallococcus exiguus]NBC39889.1 hypothetical protein [Corallococcus exiguus]TNV61354.1 hypothetical protein FH620_21365 [Corallococcus exiguus]